MRSPANEAFSDPFPHIIIKPPSLGEASIQRCIARRKRPQALRVELKGQSSGLAKDLDVCARGRRIDHKVNCSPSSTVVNRSEQHALKTTAVDISVNEPQGTYRSEKKNRDIGQMNAEIEQQRPALPFPAPPYRLFEE